MFLLQYLVASMFVDCCHTHVIHPHCSVIGDVEMASFKTVEIGCWVTKWAECL